MNFTEAIKSVFSQYATFTGRARRSEYWYFTLFCVLCSLGIMLVTFALPSVGTILNTVFSLGILIPSLAVQTRRLHDVGKSGWLIVIEYVLVIAMFVLLIGAISTENFISAMSDSGNIDPNAMNMGMLAAFGGSYLILIGYAIFLLVLTIKDSKPGDNEYGPNPKDEQEIPINENF